MDANSIKMILIVICLMMYWLMIPASSRKLMTKGNKKLSTHKLCESGNGFNSKEYKGYKPYTPPPKDYDWRDCHDWIYSNGVRLHMIKGTCHSCDYRKASCMSWNLPRYYCHRNDKNKTKQLTLGDF